MRSLLALFIAGLLLAASPSGQGAEAPARVKADPEQALWIGVRGNRLVDGKGRVVRLLGVNRSGTEYTCQQGYGFFDGPSDVASIQRMKSWRINAVRVPLNETCWLGINRIDPELGGDPYRRAIRGWVERLGRAGLYVILDLQRAAPGDQQATGIIPMPDADHAPDFWRSVAAEYRDDRAVLFDLYNEPHDVDWLCWKRGCEISGEHVGGYRAVGMRQLVAAVRSTGAEQPLLLGGIEWSRNLDQWLEYLPHDPLDSLVASNHTYDFSACFEICRADLARIARSHPVVTGELGEADCRHGYIDDYMAWADAHGASYLGWAWNAHDGWTCSGGPTLIRNFDGAPTGFGVGLRDHLRALARGG
jgi:endoglucanase